MVRSQRRLKLPLPRRSMTLKAHLHARRSNISSIYIEVYMDDRTLRGRPSSSKASVSRIVVTGGLEKQPCQIPALFCNAKARKEFCKWRFPVSPPYLACFFGCLGCGKGSGALIAAPEQH